MKSRRRKSSKRGHRNGFFQQIVEGNTYAALRDESTTIIQRLVEDTLKDSEIRQIIEEYTRKLLKAIAAKI